MYTALRVYLCVFFPPLAVYFEYLQCNVHVILNLFLWILIVPACFHAFWFCFLRKDPQFESIKIHTF
uniref:Uncharacterized protein n=1 Tax=Parascaris univalens TaxID=6257 RepID=A0A915BAF8_PARUN